MEKESKTVISPVLIAALAFGLAFFRLDILLVAVILYAIMVAKDNWLSLQTFGALGLMLVFKGILYVSTMAFEGLDLLLNLFKDGISISVFTTLDTVQKFVNYGIEIFFAYMFFKAIKHVLDRKEVKIPFIGETLKKFAK